MNQQGGRPGFFRVLNYFRIELETWERFFSILDINPTSANRLAREKSPYLLQHAHNPVDWHPWGPEAFETAHRQNKPILLSIGYSTCHWCHVMEKESFEDPGIAELMNKHFVSIKVDREEMPDVDSLYMTAVQAMTGSGGWPLNVFLTPDLKPFYGGTYFPPQPAHGRPSWPQLLERIHQVWTEKPAEIRKSAENLTEAIRKYAALSAEDSKLNPALLEECEKHFSSEFDAVHGGFGGAPKFPRPSVFYFLTRRYARTGNPAILKMVTHTLRQMARGGIYDQLGGGFARYSVDAEWTIPHFEKMLYDNAQLAVALVEAHQLSGDEFFAGIARETLAYVARDMTHSEGGFFSAEDADSEGVEGKFYLWSKEEIDKALGPAKAAVFNDFFGVTGQGNFQEPHTGHRGNILHQVSSLPEVAEKHKQSEEQIAALLDESSRKLLELRARRIRPHLDDKILTSWNGLMISAFARAAQALDDPALAAAGARAAKFIQVRLYDPKTRQLRHRWRDGEAGDQGFHADYAFLTRGLLDLYEATLDPAWLRWALDLARTEKELFYDSKDGGFFMTPAGKEHLVVRMKDDNDNAEPSSNSVAVENLLRLAAITGEDEHRRMADRTLLLFADRLNKTPFAVPQMAAAFAQSLDAPAQIVVSGDRDEALGRELLRQIRAPFMPGKILLASDAGVQPQLAGLKPADGQPTVFVCENFACKLPTSDPAKLRELLKPLLPKQSGQAC